MDKKVSVRRPGPKVENTASWATSRKFENAREDVQRVASCSACPWRAEGTKTVVQELAAEHRAGECLPAEAGE